MQTLTIAQRSFFEQSVSTYQSDLAGDTSAQTYLEARGIGPQAAATYRLGVVRRPLAGHENLTGRLVIPYLTPAGPVNFSFRCLRGHDCKTSGCPKYLPIEGMPRNLFNVCDFKRESPFICITEGELDALTLSMAGLPAIGIPGVKHWKKHWPRCFSDFDVIYAFGDGDDAGGKMNSFLAREVRARPIRLPQGKDVNALYVEGGADALRGLLD